MAADPPASETDGLICAYRLDGRGGGQPLDWADVDASADSDDLLWIHLHFTHPRARRWLAERARIDPIVVDALLAEDSRPRSVEIENGLLTTFRGVNMNPGADPEDMVSIRIWFEPRRIISTRRRRLLSVKGMRDAIDAGKGPVSPTDFLLRLVDALGDRIEPVIEQLDEDIEAAEQLFDDQDSNSYHHKFADLRRQTARIRRYLAPQRDGLERLSRQTGGMLSDDDRLSLREQADRLTRYLEDLDLVRERAMVAQEELQARLAQVQNQRIYVLSIVAAVFLPLTFITGLMGMNVAGLPGTQHPFAFSLLVIMMAAAAAVLLVFFKWKKWF